MAQVLITKSLLPEILSDYQRFIECFTDYAKATLEEARFWPQVSERRLLDAQRLWGADLERLKDHEPRIKNPDHLKSCAHLAYWLRRSAPVVGFIDMRDAYEPDALDMPEGGDRFKFRELLNLYGAEYLAFDFSFQICLFYELTKPNKSTRAAGLVLTEDYIHTVCHFLKCKNVSPHALFLIFKSIFLE
jgi:hypothetical protein